MLLVGTYVKKKIAFKLHEDSCGWYIGGASKYSLNK